MNDGGGPVASTFGNQAGRYFVTVERDVLNRGSLSCRVACGSPRFQCKARTEHKNLPLLVAAVPCAVSSCVSVGRMAGGPGAMIRHRHFGTLVA